MGDRQQQPARSRRVLQDDQNRSFGPTGPPCAPAHRYGGRGTTGKHARQWHSSTARPHKDSRNSTSNTPCEPSASYGGTRDRKSVVSGKTVSVGGDLGGRRFATKQKTTRAK